MVYVFGWWLFSQDSRCSNGCVLSMAESSLSSPDPQSMCMFCSCWTPGEPPTMVPLHANGHGFSTTRRCNISQWSILIPTCTNGCTSQIIDDWNWLNILHHTSLMLESASGGSWFLDGSSSYGPSTSKQAKSHVAAVTCTNELATSRWLVPGISKIHLYIYI